MSDCPQDFEVPWTVAVGIAQREVEFEFLGQLLDQPAFPLTVREGRNQAACVDAVHFLQAPGKASVRL
jgi:hypothetical protein